MIYRYCHHVLPIYDPCVYLRRFGDPKVLKTDSYCTMRSFLVLTLAALAAARSHSARKMQALSLIHI